MRKLIVLIFPLLFVAVSASAKTQVIELQVTEKGFEPGTLTVKPGTQVTLKITRKTDSTCATAVQIPSKKIKKELPLNKAVAIDLGVLSKGEIRFACGMKMVEGKIIAE